MAMTEITAMSITELRNAMTRAEVSAVEVARYHLDRIEATQPGLSAFTFVDADDVLVQAAAVDTRIRNGESIGKLGGIPISIKDIIDVHGVVTSACSRSALGAMAERDAEVVARLRGEDAIIIGKANCHEYGFGGPSFDLPFPPARNPWNPECFPGGSSSGSGVGVAAGLCAASIGTDTAGSIRVPSAHCGVVGLKPSHDVVPMGGVRPLSVSMDYVGSMARWASDCRIVHECIRDPGAKRSDGAERVRSGVLKGIRFGTAIEAWSLEKRLHGDILSTYRAFFSLVEDSGGRTVPAVLPSLDLIHAAASVVMMKDAADHYSDAVRRHYDDHGSVFRSRVLAGEAVTADDYAAALALRDTMNRDVEATFRQMDVLVLPVSTNPPGRLEAVDRFYFLGDPNMNIMANFLGLPSVTLPCGLSSLGLPIGLQLLGRRFSEDKLLDIAEGLERHLAFNQPDLLAALVARSP